MLAIKCSNLIVGKKSKENLKNNQVILINNDKIVSIEPVDEFERMSFDGEVIDLTQEDIYVIPGLIDTHVHIAHGGTDPREKSDSDPLVGLRMAHNAFVNLKAGITTLRDMGAKNHIDVEFKKGVELGLIPSPRILNVGKPIITTGGHCYYMGREADGPIEVAKAVREQIKARVDFIKLMVTGGIFTPGNIYDLQLKKEEIESAVETAHNAGIPVAVHAQAGKGIGIAVEAGIDTLEHGIILTEADVELMVKKGTYYVPTLVAIKEIAELGSEVGLPTWMISKVKELVETHAKSYKMARKAGLTIAAGTDYRHGTLIEELKLMVKYGASNEEALLSATSVAAEVLGKEKTIGSIEVGRYADITVVNGNPLENITNLANIKAVFVGGQVKWSEQNNMIAKEGRGGAIHV
jgi:imidazolonepropionase-like amidohydrolase